MRRRYYFFRELSKAEKELLEAVLLEEIEIQTWYAIAASLAVGGELQIAIQ